MITRTVSIPHSEMEEEDEPDPINAAELREVILHTRNETRRAKFLTMKCTAFRHLEVLRIKKKYINFEKNPPEIRLPKHVVKGKTQGRTACLDIETAPEVMKLCEELQDEDFVYMPAGVDERTFRNNEITWWRDLMHTEHFVKLGMNRVGANGQIKKIHSIRSFAMKCVAKGTGDQTIGDGYGGHKKFVGRYLDKTEDERRDIFRRSEKYMLIFTNTIVVEDNERLTKMEKKLEKYEMLDKLIGSIEQPKLEKLLENLSKN